MLVLELSMGVLLPKSRIISKDYNIIFTDSLDVLREHLLIRGAFLFYEGKLYRFALSKNERETLYLDGSQTLTSNVKHSFKIFLMERSNGFKAYSNSNRNSIQSKTNFPINRGRF